MNSEFHIFYQLHHFRLIFIEYIYISKSELYNIQLSLLKWSALSKINLKM